jgi:hypothetical protein
VSLGAVPVLMRISCVSDSADAFSGESQKTTYTKDTTLFQIMNFLSLLSLLKEHYFKEKR